MGRSSKAAAPMAHRTDSTDAMYAGLVKRSDDLIGCLEGWPEVAELKSIVDAIEVAVALRGPQDRMPGGKSSRY